MPLELLVSRRAPITLADGYVSPGGIIFSMETELKDGRLYLHRTQDERTPLVQRLGRIEGQVRGLSQMIEADRYCGDELQLASAIMAAMRSVMRLLLAQHVSAGLAHVGHQPDTRDEVMSDIDAVLAPLLREQ